jgi:hypothetical protein
VTGGVSGGGITVCVCCGTGVLVQALASRKMITRTANSEVITMVFRFIGIYRVLPE